MTYNEWSKLCKNIYEKRCVLFIGSEFPVELNGQGAVKETTFSDLLAEKLKEEIKSFEDSGRGNRFIYDKCTGGLELSQIATGYLKCSSEPRPREDLELLISSYLREISPSLSSSLFRNLLELPFQFIVDTNFTNFFANEINKVQNKQAAHSFYHFRENSSNVEPEHIDINGNIGNVARPYVYNLYGSIEKTQSIALSENELIEWLTNVIGGHSKIPVDIKNLLTNKDSCFLFIGFGFASKDWFFRILLHTLGSVNKQFTSYAMQTLNAGSDSSVVFFKVGLNVGIYPYDNHQMFVSDLVSKYNDYIKTETDNNTSRNLISGPTAFISYKSENYPIVQKIADRLKQSNINVWLDKERLTGNWDDRILEQIQKTNTFLLMQSQQMQDAKMSYVNKEINKARELMQYYREGDKGCYFFPCCIGEPAVDLFAGDAEMQKLQKWTLTKGNEINTAEIDRLALEIQRSVLRTEKKKTMAA